MLLPACGSSNDKSSDDQAAAPVETVATTDTSVAPDTTDDTSTATTAVADRGHRATNTEIRDAISQSHPDLWDLVEFSTMSWDEINGFVVPVSGDATPEQMTSLCEAVSEVVYDAGSINSRTMITIATNVSMHNLNGIAQVVRENGEGTCEPAT